MSFFSASPVNTHFFIKLSWLSVNGVLVVQLSCTLIFLKLSLLTYTSPGLVLTCSEEDNSMPGLKVIYNNTVKHEIFACMSFSLYSRF